MNYFDIGLRPAPVCPDKIQSAIVDLVPLCIFSERIGRSRLGSVQQAAEAFFDPLLVVVDASRNDQARDAIIGLDRRWNLLYVVFIERENDMIRIISVRKATRKERQYYEN